MLSSNQKKGEGLSPKHQAKLRHIVETHKYIFRTLFSLGPPAPVAPLRTELTQNAYPVRLHLCKYTKDQQEFLSKTTSKLVEAGMVYSNPTSPMGMHTIIGSKTRLHQTPIHCRLQA